MKQHAVFLNCSLKSSEELSNTQALMDEVAQRFERRQITCEHVRIVDYQVGYGITDNAGPEDEWPKIIEKLKDADIVIIGTPIWLGEKSSVSKKVLERMDGSQEITNKEGQPFFYNKVAGVVVTGNEDGAKNAISSILFGLSYLGYTVPPESYTYWLGEAGPGPSFIEAEGHQHAFTMNQVKKMVHNLSYFASLHAEHKIPPTENE
ncbi:flavodoxin family protein [Shouchella shacheensis]|uniref:flavodoxin family protein n=1 Tax=Shouchella shacheensis TaxID=1649580 RepID=UPI0007400AF3|nr:flavodoxin family protein [Shouchella shacheensis]